MYKYGILIQGPFVEGYTDRICEKYRRRFQDLPMVLSGWESDEKLLKWKPQLENEFSIHIVTSALPTHTGLHNRNLQMVNTVRGLKSLKEKGIEIAIKTRADSYIENDFRNIFESVQKDYPLRALTYNLRYRIILVESFTRIAVNYHASDMILIGHIEDLLNYFDHPLASPPGYTRMEFYAEPTVIKLTSPKYYEESPEQFFCLNFSKKIGWNVKHTLKDWHLMLKQLFYVCDDQTLGYRWYKNVWEGYGAKGMVVRHEFIFSLPKAYQTGISSLFAKNTTTEMWKSIYAGEKSLSFQERLFLNRFIIYYNALFNMGIVMAILLTFFIKKPRRFLYYVRMACINAVQIMRV